MQYSDALRNNQVAQLEATVGASPKLQLFTGAKPANCAAADTGTKLAELTLPADWLAAGAAGVVSKNGTWSGTGLAAAGAGSVIGHFRIKDSTGATCHIQGSITVTGGGGDATVDNTTIAENQTVLVQTFGVTAGNA